MATFGNSLTTGDAEWGNQDYVMGSKFTTPADIGTITSIGFYCTRNDPPSISLKAIIATE